jgi:hypothetical protein
MDLNKLILLLPDITLFLSVKDITNLRLLNKEMRDIIDINYITQIMYNKITKAINLDYVKVGAEITDYTLKTIWKLKKYNSKSIDFSKINLYYGYNIRDSMIQSLRINNYMVVCQFNYLYLIRLDLMKVVFTLKVNYSAASVFVMVKDDETFFYVFQYSCSPIHKYCILYDKIYYLISSVGVNHFSSNSIQYRTHYFRYRINIATTSIGIIWTEKPMPYNFTINTQYGPIIIDAKPRIIAYYNGRRFPLKVKLYEFNTRVHYSDHVNNGILLVSTDKIIVGYYVTERSIIYKATYTYPIKDNNMCALFISPYLSIYSALNTLHIYVAKEHIKINVPSLCGEYTYIGTTANEVCLFLNDTDTLIPNIVKIPILEW